MAAVLNWLGAPDDLVRGHINQLAARAVAKGCDLFDVLRAACLHPVEHYRMPVGQLREGDPADFILVEDLLKIAVVNRYRTAPPALGYIRGFGLKTGAIASCVAHDSHNIVAVGVTDEALCRAVNEVIRNRGGIAACDGEGTWSLALPVAGIMSPGDGYEVARQYAEVDKVVKSRLGCALKAPFMALSFMALPVIPSLKMTDRGLFDVGAFGFVEVFC